MARTLAELARGSRITDHISLGVIAKTFPVEQVKAVLVATGRASRRQRQLPGHVVVYYVIALALYMQVSYGEALRVQEFYGLMLAHFAIRGLMHEAALLGDEDPDRLSFTHTANGARRKLPLFVAIPPSGKASLS
ncbi:transposase domain-containing protein [Candidatus Sumerlaeota bacterium]|nr:transposase domain-containing protein [Candidatus Sumerlaeota bacterium]